MFIVLFIVIYLLIGLFVFFKDLNTVLKRNNLKILDIKKLEFDIVINGEKYIGYKAYLLSILFWPWQLNMK